MSTGFELRSVSKTYDGGVLALSQVSFEIDARENVAILGPSGCGKSTVLRLMAGLESPSSGQILLNGTNASEEGRVLLPPYRRNVTMVFQDLALWPNLSVLDNVLLGIAAKSLPRQDAHRRAIDALSLCKIEQLAPRKPAKISGGQQQRVALARALASRPRFLFLDEPFSGLDLVTKMELLSDISRLAKKEEITLALVSHDPMEATSLCQSAVVLNNGQIEEKGRLADLLHEPKSAILRVFKEQLKDLPLG
ncbi:MAG: ABC transporter ATP-binding protein [Deltaproteobacteria bacterium]|nr:ABC transporter ATP-binding protein [Deltaproteobacteria bacterium]